MLEKKLQEYLTKNDGHNLKRIDYNLLFLESEYKFIGGRIDILALKRNMIVGIELKARDYSSSQASAQLINYLTFLEPQRGMVYFVAPKIKPGIISTMQRYKDRIRLFEFDSKMQFKETYFNNTKRIIDYMMPEESRNEIKNYLKAPITNMGVRILKKWIEF